MAPSKPPLDFTSLSLKELRNIRLLHENLNFIQAAKLAGITQSALSQSIANIEQRLDIQLFTRNRRSVNTTIFAQLVAEQATSIFNSLDDINTQIEVLRGAREGAVAFGIGIFAASHLLEPVMSMFHRKYTDIQMRTFVNPPGELETKLLRGDIDLFVAAGDPQFRDTSPTRELLCKDDLIFVGRLEHPLSGKGAVSALQLIHFPIATYEGRFLKRQIYQLLEETEDFRLLEKNLPAAVLQQPWMLASFAEKSDYLILSSKRAMQPWLKSNALTIIEVSDLQMGIDIELVKRDSPDSSPAVELLAETIRQVVSHQYPDT